MKRTFILPALFAWASLSAGRIPAQNGGILVFKDGRSIQAPEIKVRENSYLLIFPHGQVKVDSGLVLKALLLDPSAQRKGLSSEDKKKLEKGLLPYKGRWISKSRFASLMKKVRKKRLAEMEELKKHSQWFNRYKETTRHFSFEYTVPPEVAHNYMNFFEVYWKVFNKRWRIHQPPRLGKLRVCIFSNEADFLRITGKPKGVLGYFQYVEPLELNFFHDRRDPMFTLSVLWHECNHYFMSLFVKKGILNPAWLEEGLAEYFGGSSWDPKAKKMVPGLVQEGRLVNLQDAMDGNDYQELLPLFKTARLNALQYAWAWSLCHMFFHKKKYARGFNKFIVKMAKDSTLKKETSPQNPSFRSVPVNVQVALLKKYLKFKDLDSLQKEWYAYIKSLKVHSARGYYEAAMECERWLRPIRAGLYYKKAMKLDPKYIPPYEGYARLLVNQEKYKEARKIIAQGQALDPINPTFWLLLAKIEKVTGSEQKSKRLCNLAMDLAPDDPMVRWKAQNLWAAEIVGDR